MHYNIDSIISFLKIHGSRTTYWGNKEEFSSVAYNNDKSIIRHLASQSETFQLYRRLTWLIVLTEKPTHDQIKESYLKVMSLFGLCEIGIPESEISPLVEAVGILFSKYANSDAKDIAALPEFVAAEEAFSDLRSKFRNDPRYKQKFDDVAWGWS